MTTKLLGIYEIAREVGAKRQTVAQWYKRGRLPEPTDTLSTGPVWSRDAIQGWLSSRKSSTPGERTYKGIEIWRDDLGRFCVHNPESPYSRESDHRVYGALKEAKQAIDIFCTYGRWE
jgi:predicted DNA-binding transcriptional regulator AlpA